MNTERPDNDDAEARADGSVGETGSADPEPEQSSRQRTHVLVASVAAAVLLAGGGGAYLATSLSGDSGSGGSPGANGDATPPPLALDGYSEDAAPGIAPGEPNPYGAVYRADGTLPEGPESAPVYRTRGQVTEAQVTELAKALGLDGKPVAEGQGWRIGGKDGSGPVLRVDKAAPGSWTFSRYAPGTDDCKGETCKTPPVGGGPAVSEAAARKAAAPVLKAVGQDEAKIDAGQVLGANRMVNAQPEIGGLPTHGWTTGVVVSSTGQVVGGSGRLAEPVKGDTYPVVSADRALELMNAAPRADSRAGIGGCATPVPLDEQGDRPDPCEAATTLPKAEKKDTLTVEKAVFGLAAHSVDGRQALVPSWLFEVRPKGASDTLTVTHPAVEPKYVERPEQPSVAPSEPGDQPTSAPSTRDVDVQGYTAEGGELTVVFSGGVCADYDVKVDEGGDRVKVTVTEKPWPGKICIMIAKQYQKTVPLDAPLGDREVVDADGEPVPLHKDGARLPAPPTQTR
ncbi:hypothetical protein N4P33_12735 [Streptomyces sp. 15-116A]|uniref:hypothetical protein n=1 Tax=Streptomyces sp. 15-116A TaxID=2259035 RepID=UPI0021B2F6A5|nr:hypothetical protein [Streptomyces sp. 15-116A]MCT7353033.1 hypothetical protein [Streptomyces sp. 15-116A]